MASETRKQAKFMAAVAHNADFAKKVNVPRAVGREFHRDDKKQGIIGRRRNGS